MRPFFAEGLDVLFDFLGRLEAISAKMFVAGKVACAAWSSLISAAFRARFTLRLIDRIGFGEADTIALWLAGMQLKQQVCRDFEMVTLARCVDDWSPISDRYRSTLLP